MNKILIDLPEIIETPRLKLQIPKAGFGRQLFSAVNDGYEDYVKWLNWPQNMPNIESLEEECRKHHAEFILRDFIRYLIVDKAKEKVIGRCAFPSFQANWVIPQFGISYFVCKSERSKGYATESAHAMSLLAFRILKARKLEIYCDAENVASTRIPIKLGFKLEYQQRGGWPKQNGNLAELETYSIFSEDSLPYLAISW